MVTPVSTQIDTHVIANCQVQDAVRASNRKSDSGEEEVVVVVRESFSVEVTEF